MPIHATSSYVFKSTEHAADLFALKELGNIYSRLMNPTNDVLEKRLAALDGGPQGLHLQAGRLPSRRQSHHHPWQNFISSTSLYGGIVDSLLQTFKKLGIEVRFFDPDPEQIAKLADEKTRLCVSRVGRKPEE